MINETKDTERALVALYDKLQSLFPEIHCLTFSVSQVNHSKLPYGKRYLYGFIHLGGRCYLFNNVTDLIVMVRAKIKKNWILYQSFDKLRGVLK